MCRVRVRKWREIALEGRDTSSVNQNLQNLIARDSDGRFRGLWPSIDEISSTNALLFAINCANRCFRGVYQRQYLFRQCQRRRDNKYHFVNSTIKPQNKLIRFFLRQPRSLTEKLNTKRLRLSIMVRVINFNR